MKIIKVLEHMTGHSGPWHDKDIEQAIEKIRIHKESRERIATSILQAKLTAGYAASDRVLVENSVKLADVMIEELNK